MSRRMLTTCGLIAAMVCAFCLQQRSGAQTASGERMFPQSKVSIENALKTMQANLSGHLPVLDGFAAAEHSLEQYQRGFYQASMQVAATPTGGSWVRVTVKITAWYSDPAATHSGYQLLKSNGRLESDLLEQLSDQLAASAKPNCIDATANSSAKNEPALAANPAENADRAASPTSPANPDSARADNSVTNPPNSRIANAAISAPAPANSSAEKFAAALNDNLGASRLKSDSAAPQTPPLDSSQSALRAEANELEEILKNQAHPKNLVAVKKSGTAVVGSPSLTAKPMFLASAHDEFEMLDFNQDWVHVKISGISRGWIWRNGLEMPEGIPDTASQSSPLVAGDVFHVTREEDALFPGDWAPLRGKNVKILSVQRIDENSKGGGPEDKLEYAKYLLDKNAGELTKKTQEVAGIVLIFDSADGGMIAASATTVQQWKSGSLSDSALWHNCFFDPPETFSSPAPSGSQ